MVASIYGENSMELMNEMMKLINFKWQVMDESEDEAQKRQLANELHDEIKKANSMMEKFCVVKDFSVTFKREIDFLHEKNESLNKILL